MKRSITKDQLLRMVGDSLLYEKKPFAVSFDLVEFAFGFERKSGLEIALTQLMFPTKTEKSICTVLPSQIIDNVKKWRQEYGFAGHYDYGTGTFYFTGFLPQSC